MKKFVIAAVVAFASITAFADQQTTNTSTDASAQSNNGGQANQQGVTLNIEAAQPRALDRSIADVNTTTNGTIRYEYGSQTIKNTPALGSNSLTTSNDTCMGSTSGQAVGPGIGIGFGTTWTDENCKRLKNARELWNMGMKGASMALMCGDKDNREALELTGYTCPQSLSRDEREKAFGKAKTSAVEAPAAPVAKAQPMPWQAGG